MDSFRIVSIFLQRVKSISKFDYSKPISLSLEEGENSGLVIPAYSWVLPKIVEDFLKKRNLTVKGASHYFFLVVTYGTTPGVTDRLANGLLKEKGFSFDSYYSVKMPDTSTPVFNLSDKEKVKKINDQASLDSEKVAEDIASKKKGNFMQRRPMIVEPFSKLSYANMRKTKNFHVEDTWFGCSLCARNCPIGAIAMEDKKPVWIKKSCLMCLRCLHHCPKFAIQYGKNTKKHGQYVHP